MFFYIRRSRVLVPGDGPGGEQDRPLVRGGLGGGQRPSVGQDRSGKQKKELFSKEMREIPWYA